MSPMGEVAQEMGKVGRELSASHSALYAVSILSVVPDPAASAWQPASAGRFPLCPLEFLAKLAGGWKVEMENPEPEQD